MKNLNFLRIYAVIIFLTTLTLGSVIAQPSPPSGKKWEKVNNLSDEFNSWDGNKWSKVLWNYGEPVNMLANNSGVSNGNLWIKATLGSGDRWFNTSRVMSKATQSYPMYTECRMKTAHISAFSTFWMNKGSDGGTNRDEIDICEHNSKPSWPNQADRPYTMYSQYFIAVNGDEERAHGNFDNRNLSNGNAAKGKKWNEAYQTLGCYWKDAHNVYFYINGERAGQVSSTRDFTRSLHIIWDLWTLDASWTGGIAAKSDLSNNNINTMYVDWIHTYQLVDDPNSNGNNTISFNNLPASMNTGTSLNFSVNYEASVQRDLHVILKKSDNTYLSSGKVTVNAGSGTKQITVNIDPAPAAGSYNLVAAIRTVNGDWQTNHDIDSKTIQLTSNATSNFVSIQNQGNFKYISSADVNKLSCGSSSVGTTEKFELVDAGGGFVALKGSNGKYVSSENGNKELTCNRTAIGSWEKFTLVEYGNNIYAIKGNNNMYLRASLLCTSTGISNWQQWLVSTESSSARKIENEQIINAGSDQLSVYPNPLVTGNLKITVPKNGSFNLTMFDPTGRQIKTLKGVKNDFSIHRSTFKSAGIYLLQIQSEQGTAIRKLIVE